MSIASSSMALIIDRTNEWAYVDKDGDKNPRWRGDPPPLTIIDDTGDEGSIRETLIGCRDRGLSAVFRSDDAAEVGRWVRRIGDLVYCDDEIDLTARSKGWLENPLRAFVHTGRHLKDEEGYPREVHILGACRRVQNIHTDLTEMAEEVFIFRSQGKNTIKRIIDEGWAEDADLESIKTQPNLSYHKWKNDGSMAKGFLTPLKVMKQHERPDNDSTDQES